MHTDQFRLLLFFTVKLTFTVAVLEKCAVLESSPASEIFERDYTNSFEMISRHISDEKPILEQIYARTTAI